jgi:hypothetical protein
MLNKLKEHLKMPSTWRGIFVGAGLFGYVFAPEQQEAITIGTMTLIGFIEIIRKEEI